MDNVAQRNAPRAESGLPASFSPPGGRQLAERHARYLAERGVTLEVARAAGYWTARKPAEIPPAFSATHRRRHPTLIAPHYSPDGETVSERPVMDESGRVVARIVSRLLPDGEIIERAYPIAGTPAERGA